VIMIVSCVGDPDLATLQRDPAASLRLPNAVDLGHFRGDREATIDGPQTAWDSHVFGVLVSDAEVHAFYDSELQRRGWKPDRLATSPSTVELVAWGWCKGAMIFRVGIEDQPRAFRPEFYRGYTFTTVFEAAIQGRDPALGCPETVPR
jgi:hypothetical protein